MYDRYFARFEGHANVIMKAKTSTVHTHKQIETHDMHTTCGGASTACAYTCECVLDIMPMCDVLPLPN